MVKDDFVDNNTPRDVVDADWLNGVADGINTGVVGSSNGTPTALTLWKGTQAQYDAVSPKVTTTIYIVTA